MDTNKATYKIRQTDNGWFIYTIEGKYLDGGYLSKGAAEEGLRRLIEYNNEGYTYDYNGTPIGR